MCNGKRRPMVDQYDAPGGDAKDPEPWRDRKRPRTQWWRASTDEERVAGVSGMVEHLMNIDRVRTDRYERYFKLYGGTRLIGIRPWEDPLVATSSVTANRAIQDALRLNVCKAAVDTITSKVGKLRPRPTFVTDHGDWGLQLRAKQLQRFMDGAYHQSHAHELGADVFRDAMCFGTGVMHPYRESAPVPRLCTERVPPWELYVDPADGLYGTPRAIYRVKWCSRDSARSYWPKIRNWAPKDSTAGEAVDAYREGYVRVVEAWCLAVPGVEQGAHALMVGGEMVTFEAWEYDEFPFVLTHWSKPIQGYWGDSAIQEVAGLQVEVNKLIQLVQKSMQLVGQPWVLRKEDAVLRPEKLKNFAADVIVVESTVPFAEAIQVVTFQPVHPQVVSHIWSLYSKAFEILGSNQLAASATAPPGLESGRALEALADEHSERFMTVSRHFEYQMGQGLARQFIRLAKELDAATEGGFTIRAPGAGKESLKIKWSDVDIDEDQYIMQVWPESVLPTTPSARMEHVAQLQAMGVVSPEQARRALNFPDIAADDDLATADEDNLRRQLADMLEEGKTVMPEPYQDLQRALKLAQQAVLRAGADRVPQSNVERVRDFIAAVESLLQRAAAAEQPPPGMPPPGMPPTTPPGVAPATAPAAQPAPGGMPPGP